MKKYEKIIVVALNEDGIRNINLHGVSEKSKCIIDKLRDAGYRASEKYIIH